MVFAYVNNPAMAIKTNEEMKKMLKRFKQYVE